MPADWPAHDQGLPRDPSSALELRRHDVIYDDHQLSRNPFLDHPEWADSVW